MTYAERIRQIGDFGNHDDRRGKFKDDISKKKRKFCQCIRALKHRVFRKIQKRKRGKETEKDRDGEWSEKDRDRKQRATEREIERGRGGQRETTRYR